MNAKTKLRDLRAQFRGRALAPETLFLLNADDAIDIVEKGTAEGARLAGVEGFLVSDAGAYEPRQDFSNDIAGWRGHRRRLSNQRRN
jgi:hypothetical protein